MLSCLTMRPRPILALLFALILILRVQVNEAYKDGLYSTEDDDVLPLNETTLLKRVVKNEENIVWVVEFYNSWCGHCIQFAPTWKKTASSLKVKGWRDLVRITAIDCSQSVNLGACRKFEIDRYPSIKMFSPRVKDVKDGQVMRPLESQEMNMIIHTILNFMTEFPPPVAPLLKPLRGVEDIWKEKTDKHEYVAIIFEEPESQVGRKVILDMRNTPNVLVCTMLKESTTSLGVKQFPSLYQINPDSTLSLLAIGNRRASEDQPLFVNILLTLSKGQGHWLAVSKPKKDSIQPMNDSVLKFQIPPIKEEKKMEDIPALNNSLRVSMQDLESALHYTVRQEIAICKTISGDKFNALQKFVQVLLKYFPGRQPIMKFLQAVDQMLSQVASLSGEEWIDRIDKLQTSEAFLPEVIEWDCCKGSQPRYRGYPCAMWVMFHTLTVGAYDQQMLGGARATNPLEVPVAIRGYMHHFFGCEECAKHFVEMASTMEREIDDVKGAVLWLWTAHNKANLRLKGDESEDKVFPKNHFPPVSLCSSCRTGNDDSYNGNAPTWNMESVLKFLLYFYSGKNIYISPHLSKQDYFSDGKVKAGSNSKEELDWWEKKQKDQDLKAVRLLRERKREKSAHKLRDSLLGRNIDSGVVERMSSQNLEDSDVQNIPSGPGLFNDLDLSMCVVFYIMSTAIILGLYHHFIIRKHTVPCNVKCSR